MYRHDFNEGEQDADVVQSIEDSKALSIMERSTYIDRGHYVMALPWKSKKVKLPYNRVLAERRLMCLKRRFLKDKEFFQKYKEKIEGYLVDGHAQKIPLDMLAATDRTWYIPHHATGGKFRVVFDCAARYQGTSLNENLLQGPDHTSNLLGVLLRFRKGPVAVVADIRAMFNQVRVEPKDCDSLRFLWWPDGDLSVPPQDYQMQVHLFGATSSPSCCGFALRKVAKDNASRVDPAIVDSICRSFYVDDFLRSFGTVKEAKRVVKSLHKILGEAGFHLTKYQSNSQALLQALPKNDLSVSSLNLDLDGRVNERTLGVQWNTELDQFEIKTSFKAKPVTRRGILSMVSQIYDPMGIIQPFILPAKLLMQTLCAQGLGWDEAIPDEIEQSWLRWLDTIDHLENVKLSRCIFPTSFRPVQYQLHCFCDASTSGYGAVAYLRMVGSNSDVHCSFLLGKSRVAPLKQVTIPRMELTAAVVGVNLARFLTRELDLALERVTFWTDSTSVLQYIRNTAKRFHVFVAIRIAAIHAQSDPSQWRHVDSKNNPADICSRGLMPEQLEKAEQWFHGPQFLKRDEEFWPRQPEIQTKLAASDPEVRAKMHFAAIQTENFSWLNRLFHCSSSFLRLRRLVAWLLRFKLYLLSKIKPDEFAGEFAVSSRLLTVDELEAATLQIAKLVQRQVFSNEISTLERLSETNPCSTALPKMTSKHSSIRKLNPIMMDGLMRVGGRLQRSHLSLDIKHPIILPNDHNITELIIMHFHQVEGHCGIQHTLAAVRTKFWIIKGHATVRRVLNNCRVCRIRFATGSKQIMAPLPEPRVTSGKPAFTYVGVDYAGPILTKVGRSNPKRYLCVFSCLATRAVHLEISFSLDTLSFLQTYQRFISRRGTPRKIYSDNGSNFVGAAKELRNGLDRLNKELFQNRLSQKGTDWHFNPPGASHQGGAWERMIRSIRRIMLGLTSQRLLTDEELITLVTEVERIVNNRPITTVSSDPDDLEALSPNSLLMGKIDDSLPSDVFIKADGYRTSWRLVNRLADQFWSRWVREYLPTLQMRQKWLQPTRNFRVGDIVLVVDDVGRRGVWPKGRIKEVFHGKDGHVRSARIQTATSLLLRDIRKLCLMEAAE